MLGRMTPACIFLLLIGVPAVSHAEALDDASIRALYAEEGTFGDDQKKEAQFITERMDDAFVASSKITESDNGGRPETHMDVETKAELVEQATSDDMKFDTKKSPYNISSIRYSGDHKYALVTYTSTEKGIVTDQKSKKSANLKDADACVEKVELISGKLKIMQADCNTNLSLDDR